MNLKQLSQALGLSQTTVSRALNGYPEVNEKTRERVLAAAAKVNYRPNARAQSLATGRARVIGHVLPTSSMHELVNPLFGDFVAGAAERYAKDGFDLMFATTSDGGEAGTYRDLFMRGAVDGVVVQGPKISDQRIETLNALGVPFVVHGRSSDAQGQYDWVDINNKRAFQRATELLIDLGHRRIALINGLEDMDFAHRRRTGYLAALEKAGLPVDPALMRSAAMTEVYGHRETAAMLKLSDPPTAVLAASMITAIGVRRAIEAAGLTLGRDVSVVTHDDELSYLRNGQSVPIFTATRSSIREAGGLVADMLLSRIEAPDAPPRQMLLEAELVLGDSTGPLRASG